MENKRYKGHIAAIDRVRKLSGPHVNSHIISTHTHSKAGKHQLRHVGLALLCNWEEGVPLFHRLYSANTHDSKLFSQIQRELFQLLLSLRKGKERMTLVFDKGCNSPENYNGFVDSDQNGSQFKVYLLTIKSKEDTIEKEEKIR